MLGKIDRWLISSLHRINVLQRLERVEHTQTDTLLPAVDDLQKAQKEAIFPNLQKLEDNQKNSLFPRLQDVEKTLNESVAPGLKDLKKAHDESTLPRIGNLEKTLNESVAPDLHNLEKNMDESIVPWLHNLEKNMDESIVPWLHNLEKDLDESIRPWNHNLQSAVEKLQSDISDVSIKTENLYFDRFGDLNIDYLEFENHFRGPVEDIKKRFNLYLPHFLGCSKVLDIGCGRGEMISLLKENGINAQGVDCCPEMVAFCKDQGLDVELQDAFAYLASQPDDSWDGIFMGQVAEHLGTRNFIKLTELCRAKLRKDGIFLYETLNPENMDSMKWFYMDFTHVYPIHPVSAAYILQQKGWRKIERVDTCYPDVDYALLCKK